MRTVVLYMQPPVACCTCPRLQTFAEQLQTLFQGEAGRLEQAQGSGRLTAGPCPTVASRTALPREG